MQRFKLFLILFLIFALPLAVLAQPGKITGKVIDAKTGRPLAGANILVVGTHFGATTDASGHYVIRNLPPGKYVISVHFIGYRTEKKIVRVGSRPVTLNFHLPRQAIRAQEVVITANRAVIRETPVAFTNLSRTQLKQNYWSQDIPMLLTEVPGVYSYSDAGNGVGYTYVKIRGFDQKRVSVMINGIPLNDPEDHQVYWVDMPDLASSVRDIQIQRGVGSSLYASSSFGGSINVVTGEPASDSKIRVTTGAGSYNTRKFAVNLNSGLVQNKYVVQARFSKILSDGYRENTGVDLWAYFLGAVRYGKKLTTKINVYGGPELTHAGWYASAESDLKKNHRYNPIKYKNTIDNFNQPHYEFIQEWKPNDRLSFSNTLFYIHGIGYYEGLKNHKKLVDFGYQPFYTPDSNLVTRTDLVRQKWVKKNQVGWIPRLNWKHARGNLSIGLNTYSYWSDHWGKVIWAAQLPHGSSPDHRYYGFDTRKKLATIFAQELYHPVPALSVMSDLNVQFQKYTFKQRPVANFTGANRHAFEVTYTFWNPKFGLNYNVSSALNIFGNVSVAHREPSDDDLFDVWQGPDDLGVHPLFAHSDTVRKSNGSIDYIMWHNPLTKPEELLDFELGLGYRTPDFRTQLNLYQMNFRNEIVPYSQVDKDGFPIKGNAEKTIHRGIEATTAARICHGLQASGSISLSQNYFAKFEQYQAIYDQDWNFVGTKRVDFSGKTIAGFPNVLASAKLTYTGAVFGGFLQIRHVGKQYLDNTQRNDRSIRPYTLVNAHISVQLKNVFGIKALRLSFWGNNLLNKKYETAGYYDDWEGENYLWPGADRNYFAGFEINP